MTTHSSAAAHEATPHVSQTTRTATIINALKRRAQAVLNDESIDAQSRAIIRYGLETNDPWLAELVRRSVAAEKLVDSVDFSETPGMDQNASVEHNSNEHSNRHASSEQDANDGSGQDKLERLIEMICGAGEESAAALLVLMGMLGSSAHPEVLVNTAKHLAFTLCGELNLHGMVDAQIAVIERELWPT